MANNTNPLGASGGVSLIAYLQKQRDGVVFQETFENQNFVAADGWTIQRGTPANTQSQAVAGISSFDCTAGNQSMPVIYKNITDTNVDFTGPGSFGWMAQTWFYDPITSTSAGALYTTSSTPGPYFKIKTTNGNYASVGVRTSVSTSSYSYGSFSSGTDAPTSATSVVRTNGWHSLTFVLGNAGARLLVYVDTNNIFPTTIVSNPVVSQISVCAGTSAEAGSSFGNFDAVGYYRNAQITFSGSSASVTQLMFNGNNNRLDQSTPQWYDYQFPIPLYIEVQVVGSVVGPTSAGFPVYRTPLMNYNPGDIYQFQSINFGRKVTTYDPMIKELQSVNQSTGGVRETNSYGLKGPVSFSVNSLTGWSWKQAADNFFLNCVQGNPFGFFVDSITDNAIGVIATSAFGGETNTVQIMPSVTGFSLLTSAQTTQQFTAGNYYYVRNNANTQKQLVNLTSMTTSTLIFDQNLNFNVFPLDYVYSLQLYPFLEVSGDTQTGFKCTDTKYPRFTWQQSCVDYNNG